MRCSVSVDRLVRLFDITVESALLIKTLCRYADSPHCLEDVVDSTDALDSTEEYVNQMYSSPYLSAVWRRTVVLHAINVLIDGHGVECSPCVGLSPPTVEYINMGDLYSSALVYKRSSDNLFVGCFADSVPS